MMYAFIKREYDYAIRICAYLAGKPRHKPVPVSRISHILAITRPFATKILNKLRLKGITSSIQGKFGGVFLNVDPHHLSILDILKAMDFNSTLNECIHNPSICPLVGFCHIHIFFNQQEKILLENFEKKMIIDFAIFEKDLVDYRKNQPNQSPNSTQLI